jgi:hypothetical protein
MYELLASRDVLVESLTPSGIASPRRCDHDSKEARLRAEMNELLARRDALMESLMRTGIMSPRRCDLDLKAAKMWLEVGKINGRLRELDAELTEYTGVND